MHRKRSGDTQSSEVEALCPNLSVNQDQFQSLYDDGLLQWLGLELLASVKKDAYLA